MPEIHIDITLQAKAYRVIRGLVADRLEHHNLNPTLWSLLSTVATSRDGIRLTEVAGALGVKAPLVTMMADQLIAQDLIERVPHMFDKRAKLLVITAVGKKLVATVDADLDKSIRPLLTGVTRKDLSAFHRVITVIASQSKHQS